MLAPLAGAFILWWSHKSGAFGPAVGLLVWLAVGLIVAHVHTMRMSTPLLYAGQMPWVTVEGTIKSIDYRDDGERLIVQNLKVVEGARMRWLDGAGLQLKPQHQNQAFSVGQRVGGRVQLFPIGPPPVPGSLDLQFRAYFDGVSAYGATRGPLTVLDDTSASDFRAYVEALRQRIRANIVQTLGEERGSVLVAMTVGFPRAVPEEKRGVAPGWPGPPACHFGLAYDLGCLRCLLVTPYGTRDGTGPSARRTLAPTHQKKCRCLPPWPSVWVTSSYRAGLCRRSERS